MGEIFVAGVGQFHRRIRRIWSEKSFQMARRREEWRQEARSRKFPQIFITILFCIVQLSYVMDQSDAIELSKHEMCKMKVFKQNGHVTNLVNKWSMSWFDAFGADALWLDDESVIEWFQVLVLRELALSMPTFFFQQVQTFFDVIFSTVRDSKANIREGAVSALRSALVVTSQRETKETLSQKSRMRHIEKISKKHRKNIQKISKKLSKKLYKNNIKIMK